MNLKQKLNFHPLAWGVIFGTFLSRAGFFMNLPFLGIYLYEVKGVDPATTGAILAVSFFVSTFMSFFGGALSDKLGRISVMFASMLLWGFVFVGFAIADQIVTFFLLNALNGLCRSVFEPSARALLVDVTPDDNRIAVFNARYYAINLGGAIGPLVGLSLGASKNPLPFLISAGIYFIYALIILYWHFKYKNKGQQENNLNAVSVIESLRIIAGDKVFRYFLIGNIFVTGAYSHLDTTLSQYLGTVDVSAYSVLFISNTVFILLFQFPIMKLMKKYSYLTALKAGCILFGLGLFGFGLSKSIPVLLLSMFLFTAGEILCFIIGDVLISDIAPNHLRGAYYGAAGLQFIGQGGSAWLGGILLSSLGFGQGVIIFAILGGLAVSAFPFFKFGEILLTKKKEIFTADADEYSVS
ncbi:MDR family MFS transporter [Fictibacillus barbaricus]|uniref:MFS family permease n=1 Tax=Fictibacillus barbaricus TaxID=182136 RepID=A0ABU1TW82_9BACL|nr:MFS transporter [Fictibacillus barbaricus]MDR7071452.1 MFS family permease [Fictibacillus barbaricus]